MVYRLCLAIILVFCSGCVTTSKVSLFCNKTIDLDKRPLEGTMDVGIRLELFRNWEQNMRKIIVSTCGWCEADPEKVRFQITSGDGEEYITGTEWLELPESGDEDNVGRDDYILECAGTAFATALDGEYDQVDVEVEG